MMVLAGLGIVLALAACGGAGGEAPTADTPSATPAVTPTPMPTSTPSVVSILSSAVPINRKNAGNLFNIGNYRVVDTVAYMDRVAFSADGTLMMVCNDGKDGFQNLAAHEGFYLYNINSSQRWHILNSDASCLHPFAITDSNRTLAINTSDQLSLIDIATSQTIQSIPIDQRDVITGGLVIAPNGESMAAVNFRAASPLPGEAGSDLILFNLEKDTFSPLEVEGAEVVAYTPYGNDLIIATTKGVTLRRSNGETSQVFSADNLLPYMIAISPLEGQLALAQLPPAGSTTEVPVVFYDLETGELQFSLKGTTTKSGNVTDSSRIVSMTYSPSGDLLLTATRNGTVRLWSTSTGKAFFMPEDIDDEIVGAAFAPNAKAVVIFTESGIIRYWGVPSSAIN
jgi:WD40 repeat protein